MRGVTIRLRLLVPLLVVAACGESSTTAPSSVGGSPTLPVAAADVIFRNGTVITINRQHPTAEAVAIKGQLIQAVGTEEEVLAYKGSGTVVVDLQGRTLMPGFEDGHMHYLRNKWGEGAPLAGLMNDLLSFGLTSVTEMHSVNEFINAMLDAERQGQVALRVNIFGEYNCGGLVDHKSVYCPSWYPDHPPILEPTHLVRVPGVKIFVDGAGIAGRGCPYMSFQYSSNVTDYWPDEPQVCGTPYGDLYLTEDQLTTVLKDVQDHGYRAAFHVMGDAALDVTLNAIQRASNGTSNLVYRHQIQHNSTVRPDQLPRYQQLNVLAQVPGYFNTCEAADYEAMYPRDTYTYNTNRYALPGMGVHTYWADDANGKSDIHKVGTGPIYALYGLVTRRQFRAEGTICEPPAWISKYKISVQQALEMVTIEPAYAVSMEDHIGSVEPGKFADLIVLSDNPLTMNPDDLYKLQVWTTMVNGAVKYCAPGKDAYCPVAGQSGPAGSASPTAAAHVTRVKWNCDAGSASPVHVPAGDSIQTYIGWAAKTEAQLNDYEAAVRGSIFVDGGQIQSAVSHGAVEQLAGQDMVVVQSTFDVGVLSQGTHTIRTTLTFAQKITDGVDWYGPGSANPTVEGTCSVAVGD